MDRSERRRRAKSNSKLRVISAKTVRMDMKQRMKIENDFGEILSKVMSADVYELRKYEMHAAKFRMACELGAFKARMPPSGEIVVIEIPDAYRKVIGSQTDEVLEAIRQRRKELGVIR